MGVYKKFKRKKRGKPGKKPIDKSFIRIAEYAAELNANLPESEKWFWSIFDPLNLPFNFKKNYPWSNRYITDAIELDYKIIIEIDGGYHETEKQKLKDAYRDLYFIRRGFKVFRIKHGDLQGFNELVIKLKELTTSNRGVVLPK